MSVKFSWDVIASFGAVLSDDEEEEEEEEEEREANEDLTKRLKHADDVTRTMTKEEYMYFSECRQASFTFKKAKRFREWCQMSTYYTNTPNADIIDILGFLGYEIVSKLTETALDVKREWDERIKHEQQKLLADSNTSGSAMREPRRYLFGKPNNETGPIRADVMQEAFRRLQNTERVMDNFMGGWVRTNLSLI